MISWQSIIAGTIAALAISIVLGVLGVALGFTVIKPTSDEPTSGLGVAFGVWGVISVILSLAVGGYVAGMFSGVRGVEHGFMVWATVLIAATLFSGLAVGSAVKTVGAAVRSIGNSAASVASSVGHSVSGIASSAVDHVHHSLQNSVNLDFDSGELKGEVGSVLRDTNVPTLQPEYLKSQMQEVKDDLKESIHQFRLNSENYDQIAASFLDKQKGRLENITKDVDKNAAVNAVMSKRNIARAEAEKEVDNAINVYNKAVAQAESAIMDVQKEFNDAKLHIKQMADQARVKADRMASTAAKSALAAAVALILGAVICCYAAFYGNAKTDWNTAFIMQERRMIEVPVGDLSAPVRVNATSNRP